MPCSADECHDPARAKGLCNLHYKRLRRLSALHLPDRPPRPVICEVEGCERKVTARGWCTVHYQRWAKYGDPLVTKIGNWVGDDAGYQAIHGRLARHRGKASTHTCPCGQPANDWAYDGACPNEKTWLVQGTPLAYSTDLARYAALCRRCHILFDENVPAWRRAKTG